MNDGVRMRRLLLLTLVLHIGLSTVAVGPQDITAVWSPTESKGIPTSPRLPEAAILGNGDLGLVNADFALGKRFVVTKGDFLSGGSFGTKHESGPEDFRSAAVGRLKVELEGAAPAEDTLAIATGDLTSRFAIPGGGRAVVRTYVARTRNVIVSEIAGAKGVKVALRPEVPAANGFPCGSGTLSNGDAFAWRRTLNTSGGAEGSWRSEVAMVSRLLPGEPQVAVTAVFCARQCFDAQDRRVGADAVAEAEKLLEKTLAEGLPAVRTAHEAWWADYWSRGGIDLGDERLERYYYGSLYLLAVAAPFGYSHIAPGLYGTIVTTDEAGWQNDLHLNYNYQAPFYGACAANRPEFIRGLVEPILEYLPQAKWNARHELDCIDAKYVAGRPDLKDGIDGAFYPVSLFPQGGRDPKRRLHYWNQTMNAPLTAALFCTYWEYTHDRTFWVKVYPFLKATADFYVRWCEREATAEDTYRYVFWDSCYEGGNFGKNCSPTLAFVRHLFRTLAVVEEDVSRVAVWRDYAEHLAPWPVGRFRWKDFDRETLSLVETDDCSLMFRGDGAVELEGVVPGEAFSFDVTPEFRTLATNTVDALIARGGWTTLVNPNQTPKLYVTAIRTGYPCAKVIDWFKRWQLDAYGRKNFTLCDGVHGIEKSGGIEFIQSMLLQCDNGFVKVFPNWTGADASFTRLRAKGAFLLSAEMKGGRVTRVEIESLVGGELRLVDPFGSEAPAGWEIERTRHSGEKVFMRRFSAGEKAVLTSAAQAREVNDGGCDVCVIGGGAAGIGAALAAGQCGARTVLVERDVRLGGTTVLSDVALPGLFHGWGGRQVVSGPCWDLVTNAVAVGNGFVPDPSDFPKAGWWRYSVRVNPHVYGMLAEEQIRKAGVKIVFATFPRGLMREGGLWKIVLVSDAGESILWARTLVDATGNATVAAMAGGRRLREPDVSRQPGSVIFALNTKDMHFDAAALDHAWAAAVKAGELRPTDGPAKRISGWVRAGGGDVWSYVPAADNSTAECRADTNWRGRQLMLRVLRFLRRQPGLEHATITSSAAETGVRETYRVVGDTVITQEDFLSGRIWPDSVCYAFWYVDAHSADRAKHIQANPKEGVFPTVPLSAMVPRGVPGMLVAGRAVSSDHTANSALRVQAACMAMGQAAGVAGALAAESACDVRDVPASAVRLKLSALGAVVPSPACP